MIGYRLRREGSSQKGKWASIGEVNRQGRKGLFSGLICRYSGGFLGGHKGFEDSRERDNGDTWRRLRFLFG